MKVVLQPVKMKTKTVFRIVFQAGFDTIDFAVNDSSDINFFYTE